MARNHLRAKLDRYNLHRLKADRDSLAGNLATLKEDLNRLTLRDEAYQEDLQVETETRIALELLLLELTHRDSLLTEYNADWLIYSSLLEDSIQYYQGLIQNPDSNIQPRTYRNSIGGILAFIILLYHIFFKRKH